MCDRVTVWVLEGWVVREVNLADAGILLDFFDLICAVGSMDEHVDLRVFQVLDSTQDICKVVRNLALKLLCQDKRGERALLARNHATDSKHL